MKKVNVFLSVMAALFVFGACSKYDNEYIEDKGKAGRVKKKEKKGKKKKKKNRRKDSLDFDGDDGGGL